ncbi:MAG: DUF2341 domain-containing protein, partial [Candidatus Helarchaeota archaeon]
MNSSLKDIRIVENNVLRNYFVQKDYPKEDMATVWFETNCSAGATEYDTYLYYGNNSVERAEGHYNMNNRFGLAWYTFDEGSGNPTDSTGNYIDGTLINMEQSDWDAGRVGTHSLRFDGTNEYVSLPSINPTSAITVSAWIKSASSSYYSGVWQMISKYSAYILGTYGVNSRRMAFIIYSNGWKYDSYYDVPDPDQWHLFIGTYDSSTGQKILYMDGEFKDDYYTSGTINADTGPIHIARREGGTAYYFNGWIDDVRFYDYALSTDEIKGLYNYSEVSAVLNEEQTQYSEVKITTYDVDGRIVPNALVSLINKTTGQIIISKNTSIDGTVTFQDLNYGVYNITIKYKSGSGSELVVYNSSKDSITYNFTGLHYNVDIELNLWTIDFEIVDWDGNPLNYAYINVSETPAGKAIESLEIVDGKAIFRWKNQSKYYYKIFYNNDDYSNIPVQLNESYIYRDKYIQNEKYFDHEIWVNQSNILTGTEYRVQKNIYTNGLTQLGNKLLLKANITLKKMTDYLDTVKIYYIDKNGGCSEGNLIYLNDSYSGGQNDFIEINIRKPPLESNNLKNDNYEAYGLRIDVRGFNSTSQTRCNGTIKIRTTEACYIYNKTSLAKLKIRVLDQKVAVVPVQSCIIRVNDSLGNTITNLITDYDGYAHGQKNSDTEFWYLRLSGTENYTFILNFYGVDKAFIVNVSDQWKPSGMIYNYNYSLKKNSTLVFKIQIDISNYLSNFTNCKGVNSVIWGENMSFSVNYTVKAGSGAPWKGLNDPDDITCTIGIKSFRMKPGLGNGNFTLTINSSVFSAGDVSEIYWVEIRGSKLGYIDPEPVYFGVTLHALPTNMTILNYPTYRASQYWGETINFTVNYFKQGNPNALIKGASLTYSWQYGSGVISENPINSGNYTFQINTSLSPDCATFKIDISAKLENYTKIDNFGLYINILTRPTSLNGSSEISYVSKKIYILDQFNFTFEYTDIISSIRISNPDEISYKLQKLDKNGEPIEGETATGNLWETSDHKYVLDINTETLEVGKYFIFLTFYKKNYEDNVVIIDFEIQKRIFDLKIDATNLENDQINVVKGEDIEFEIKLTDPTNGDIPLIGAKVTLVI